MFLYHLEPFVFKAIKLFDVFIELYSLGVDIHLAHVRPEHVLHFGALIFRIKSISSLPVLQIPVMHYEINHDQLITSKAKGP